MRATTNWSYAKEKGFKKYFTGIPCKHGHIDERYTCNRECVECDKIRKQARKAKSIVKKVVCNFVEPAKTKTLRVVSFEVDQSSLRREGFNKFRPVVVKDKMKTYRV